MDTAVLVVLATSIPGAIVGILSQMTIANRRTRARMNRQARHLDEANAYIYHARQERWAHDEKYHKGDPESGIGVRELPAYMKELEIND